jgi:hypothetical protein
MPDDTEALVDRLVAQDENLPAHERMREALARMQALGLGKQYTEQDLWAAQAQSQWPKPALPEDLRRSPVFNDADVATIPLEMQRPQGYGGADVRAPMPIFSDDDRFLRFPRQGEPKPGEGEAPFGGKALVVGPAPGRSDYELPKKTKKKGKG